MFKWFCTIFSLGTPELQIIHRVIMTAFNSVDQLQSVLNGTKSNAAIATDLKTSLLSVDNHILRKSLTQKRPVWEQLTPDNWNPR